MLAKLLSLLLHAKSGAISGVLLLGATGALVSVSASNGVTTITITEASSDPSTEVTTTRETETPKQAGPKLSSSVSTTACTDEATGLATEVQRVNSAFSGFHTDLMHLRGERAAATIETADVTLKVVRQAAVKAIHATATGACAKQDDEDENDTDENDETDNEQTVENDTDENNDEDANDTDENNDNDENDGDHGKTAVAPVTFSGTATEIADNAILLMEAAFNVADTATVLTPKSEHSSEQRTNDDKKHGSEHHD